jgi:hypothetical protein
MPHYTFKKPTPLTAALIALELGVPSTEVTLTIYGGDDDHDEGEVEVTVRSTPTAAALTRLQTMMTELGLE